jgi:protocatechuate 3,4-dioxygenase beta subunit
MKSRAKILLIIVLGFVFLSGLFSLIIKISKEPHYEALEKGNEKTEREYRKSQSSSGKGEIAGVTLSGKIKIQHYDVDDELDLSKLIVELKRLSTPVEAVQQESITEKGAFKFQQVTKGEYSIRMLPHEAWTSSLEQVNVKDANISGIELLLQQKVEFMGVVTDNSNRPIEGAEIFICEKPVPVYCQNLFEKAIKQGMGRRFVTDEKGKFKGFSDGGTFHVIVRKAGYAFVDQPSFHFRNHRLSKSELASILIALPNEAKVIGRIFDTHDKPVSQALVMVRWNNPDGKYMGEDNYSPFIIAVYTDEAGEFQIDSLYEGPYELFVQNNSGTSGTKIEFSVQSGDIKNLENIKVTPLRVISGIVETEGKELIKNALIKAEVGDKEHWWISPSRNRDYYWDSATPKEIFPAPKEAKGEITSDRDGRFSFYDIDAGNIIITAETSEDKEGSTEVKTNGDADVVVIIKEPYSATIMLSVLYGQSNKPVKGAEILFLPEKHSFGFMKKCVSDSNGKASMTLDIETLWGIMANGEGKVSEVALFKPEAGNKQNFDLLLMPAASLNIMVVSEETKTALANAKIYMFCEYDKEENYVIKDLKGALDKKVRTNSEGRATIPIVPAGKHSIIVSYPGFKTSIQTIDVGNEHKELTFELQKAAILKGRVIDAKGNPIACAQIYIEYASLSPTLMYPEDDTDEVGTFYIGEEASIIQMDESESVVLYAKHPLYALGRTDVFNIKQGDTLDDISITLTQGNSISGKVTDKEGKPIASVKISYELDSEREKRLGSDAIIGDFGDKKEKENLTDTDGRYQIKNVMPGKYTITAFHKNYVEKTKEGVNIEEGIETTGIDFVLDEGLTLAGTVVDRDDKPIEGVNIYSGYDWDEDKKKTVTDGNGAFTIAGLSAGFNKISMEKEGYITLDEDVKLPSEPKKFVLIQAGGVKGKLVDGLKGTYIQSSDVEVRWGSTDPLMESLGGGSTMSTSLDIEKGSFQLDELELGTVSIKFSPRGYSPKVIKDIEIKEGEITDLGIIKIGKGTELTVKIINEKDRSPLEGALLAMVEKQFNDWEPINRTIEEKTDASGKYVFENLSSGTHTLRVVYGNYNRKIVKVEIAESEKKEIEVSISAGASLSGRIFEKKGNTPVANAEVTIEFTGSTSHQQMPSPKVTTNNDGSFAFTNLALGSYTIEAYSKDYAKVSQDVDIKKEQQTVDLMLEKSGSIAVLVKDSDGKPLPEYDVGIDDSDYAIRDWGKTDVNGKCLFKNLPERKYEISVEKNRTHWSAEQTLRKFIYLTEGQDAQIKFIFSKGYKVFGKVTKAGAEVPNIQLWINDTFPMSSDFHFNKFLQTDENGHFELISIPTGKYEITAMGDEEDGSSSGRKNFEVIDKDVEVNLELEENANQSKASVNGIVTDSQGQPLESADIFVAKTGDSERRTSADLGEFVNSTKTDKDGKYTLLIMEKSEFDVRVTFKGYAPVYKTINIKENEQLSGIDFKLETSTKVTGKIETEDGFNIDEAVFSVVNASGRELMSDGLPIENGSYIINNLPKGTVEITAFVQGYVAEVRRVEIVSEQISNINFKLSRGHSAVIVVKDSSGKPIRGAEAQTADKKARFFQLETFKCAHGQNTVSDENGVITLKALAPKSYSLTISKEGYKTANLVLSEQAKSAEVILQKE